MFDDASSSSITTITEEEEEVVQKLSKAYGKSLVPYIIVYLLPIHFGLIKGNAVARKAAIWTGVGETFRQYNIQIMQNADDTFWLVSSWLYLFFVFWHFFCIISFSGIYRICQRKSPIAFVKEHSFSAESILFLAFFISAFDICV